MSCAVIGQLPMRLRVQICRQQCIQGLCMMRRRPCMHCRETCLRKSHTLLDELPQGSLYTGGLASVREFSLHRFKHIRKATMPVLLDGLSKSADSLSGCCMQQGHAAV